MGRAGVSIGANDRVLLAARLVYPLRAGKPDFPGTNLLRPLGNPSRAHIPML